MADVKPKDNVYYLLLQLSMNIKKVVISSVVIAVVAVMSVIGYAYANNMFSQKQKPSDFY